MLNNIIDGISIKLDKTFGESIQFIVKMWSKV